MTAMIDLPLKGMDQCEGLLCILHAPLFWILALFIIILLAVVWRELSHPPKRTAVILAAGKGTRMGQSVPKALITIGGKTLVEWQLDALKGLATEVFLVVRSQDANEFRRATEKDRRVQLYYQNAFTAKYGTWAALAAIKPWLPRHFVVLYGDCYYHRSDLKRLFAQKNSVLVRTPNPNPTGGVSLKRGHIQKIMVDGSALRYGFTGAVHLYKGVLEHRPLKSIRDEYELTDSLTQAYTPLRALVTRRWCHFSHARDLFNQKQYGLGGDHCVNLWLEKDGKLLLMQRSDEPWTLYPGHWQFLGGHLEPGETPAMALRRELHEEVGLTLKDNTPLSFDQYTIGDRTEWVYTLVAPHEFTPTRLSEGQRLQWIPHHKLATLKWSPPDQALYTRITEVPHAF